MGTWALIQVVFDIFAALGFFVIIMRMNRAPKDDPRLSRGLQLLQSKISVLEDLSDRTELQVNQLAAILDQKAKEVQAKVQLAEQHVHELRVSMERSLDVAKIFQDKIPHAEIIERQNTIKYVQAARLAHQGLSADEIAQKIDLPKGEIEFIAKVNRDQLMFSEDQLPTWAQGDVNELLSTSASQADVANASSASSHGGTAPQETNVADQAVRLRAEMELAEQQRLVENLSRLQFEMQNLDIQLARESSIRDMSSAFETPKIETGSLQKLGEEFRKACEDAEKNENRSGFLPPLDQLSSLIPQLFTGTETDEAPTALFMPSQQAPVPSQPLQAQPQASSPAPAPASPPKHVPVAQTQAAVTSAAHQLSPVATSAAATPGATAAAQPAPMVPSAQAEKPADPMLARALAQAKVQAALKAGAKAQPAAQAQPQQVPSELSAARALAKEGAAQPQPIHIINGRGTNKEAPIVRKVQFPKIESPEG